MTTKFILLLVLSTVLTSIIRVVSGTGQMAMYKKMPDRKVQSSSVPLQSHIIDKPIIPEICALMCVGNANCQSFDIEKTSSTCHLYQWKLFSIPKTAAILVNSVGWDHYETREGMSQNILYN